MNRVGDSCAPVDWSIVSPFPEEIDPVFVCEQQQFDFHSIAPFPLKERTISPPISPEKTDHVFKSRKQKRPEENDPGQKKQKSAETIPASLKTTKKDSRQEALEQFHALLKKHPLPKHVPKLLTARYYNAINLKFPAEFNNFLGIKTAFKRYEHKYGKPCPDISLDPEIAIAFTESGISQETKEQAVGIIKACLSYQPGFGLQDYIDIACQLLKVEDSLEKTEIKKFYESNKNQYPAARWTSKLEQQVIASMKKMFSNVFVDEVLGQYAALQADPLTLSILSKAYEKDFNGKLKSPYSKIRRWVRDHPLPEKIPPLNDKVKQAAETIRRQAGNKPVLGESEIKAVVGHFKACLEYLSNSIERKETVLELTKRDCKVSVTPWCIHNYYEKYKDQYPVIPLSEETKLELLTIKNQRNKTEGFQSSRDEAIAQYGALLAHTNSSPSLKHIRHFNAINNKWPNVFSNIDALRTAYRRAPKKAPLDPDIQKAFDESTD